MLATRSPLFSGEPKAADSPAANLVRDALRAEISGDDALRDRLLREARHLEPEFPPARWHSGHVRVGDDWVPVGEAERRVAVAGIYQQYRLMRGHLGGSAGGEIELARWCRKNHFDELEKQHWWQVLRFAPQHPVARRRLGVRDYHGFLLTDHEIEQCERQLKQRQADREHWMPQATAWRRALSSDIANERAAALAELASVEDPVALLYVEPELRDLDAEVDLAVVALLAKLKGPSLAFVRFAVRSPYPSVREAAETHLQKRSWYSYVPQLLSALQAPIEVSGHAGVLGNGSISGVSIEQDTPTGLLSKTYSHRSFAGHVHSITQDVRVVESR